VNVVHEVNMLARKVNAQARVISLTLLNGDKEGLDMFLAELKESIRVGHWIIVENCHLVDNWPLEILQLLFVSFIEFVYFCLFYNLAFVVFIENKGREAC